MKAWLRTAWRGLLSAHVLNGVSVALGILVVAALTYTALGELAAINASVGAIITLIPDQVRPRRGKFTHLIAAPLLGVPLFLAVQLLRPYPLELGLLLVPATFIAFLATAWGARGMPVAIAAMLAMLLAMAPQPAASVGEALARTGYCALGAALYVLYGTASNSLLNGRYRAQALADLLLNVAALLRVHARRIARTAGDPDATPPPLGAELGRHAALADQMQAARDLILERPDTPRRQRLAAMLMVALEMRDRLIASELDMERIDAAHAGALCNLAQILEQMAADVDGVADALLLARKPPAPHDQRPALAELRAQADAEAAADRHSVAALTQASLVRSLSTRHADQDAAVRQLAALGRGEVAPDLSAVRNGWQLFVSPAYWSAQPLLRLWRWRQPALRHALRAAAAVGAGYALARLIPWGSRDYWVLITIVVVLRGNLAQTLQRLNLRVLGTLIGSIFAALLLAIHPPIGLLVAVAIASQGIAHAFAVRRYLVAATAGSVLALVLAHLLETGVSPTFDLIERVVDTLLGVAIAWLFSYVLPSWERDRVAELMRRVCTALQRHAQHSLALAGVTEITGQPELAWRLARREAYDALSALVQATGRSAAEPRAVRSPIATLEQLQARSYQLLGQLSAIQSLLLLRRQRLRPEVIQAPIAAAASEIEAALDLSQPFAPPEEPGAPVTTAGHTHLSGVPEDLPDPLAPDSSPWLLRRLALAVRLAQEVRADAECVLERLTAEAPSATPQAQMPQPAG